MNRVDLLNALARQIGARRYLEIGVQAGECFRRVEVAEKVGVDPDRSSASTVKLPSDAYFATLDPNDRFDLIFVDGLHHSDQVLRDILNARRHLNPNGAILVHDCDPPNERAGQREMCPGVWCGDVWRGWLDARHAIPDAFMAVVDTDLGCGLIVPGEPDAPTYPADLPGRASWSAFRNNRRDWLNIISVTAFRGIVAGLQPVGERP